MSKQRSAASDQPFVQDFVGSTFMYDQTATAERAVSHFSQSCQSTLHHPPLAVGLTLVEILVAMSIAGIFCIALYGFYRLHTGVLKAEEVRITLQESSRLATDFIVRELRFAGARPIRGGPCDGFAHVSEADEQTVTIQYDFRGNTPGAPADGCPDDPNETITYTYDSASQLIRRATGGGAPQPFISDVPPDGFLLQYFDRDGNELVPPLDDAERAAVQSIFVVVQTSKPHPNPQVTEPIISELSSTIFLPNPPE
jgi:hypothetical protein